MESCISVAPTALFEDASAVVVLTMEAVINRRICPFPATAPATPQSDLAKSYVRASLLRKTCSPEWFHRPQIPHVRRLDWHSQVPLLPPFQRGCLRHPQLLPPSSSAEARIVRTPCTSVRLLRTHLQIRSSPFSMAGTRLNGNHLPGVNQCEERRRGAGALRDLREQGAWAGGAIASALLGVSGFNAGRDRPWISCSLLWHPARVWAGRKHALHVLVDDVFILTHHQNSSPWSQDRLQKLWSGTKPQ